MLNPSSRKTLSLLREISWRILRLAFPFYSSLMGEVIKHRERMQRMHKDFFSILKWQRKRMQELLEQESEQILGDIPQLKNDLAEEKKAAEEAAFKSKFGDASDPHSNMSSSQMAQVSHCRLLSCSDFRDALFHTSLR